jgi:hypothetical protein
MELTLINPTNYALSCNSCMITACWFNALEKYCYIFFNFLEVINILTHSNTFTIHYIGGICSKRKEL